MFGESSGKFLSEQTSRFLHVLDVQRRPGCHGRGYDPSGSSCTKGELNAYEYAVAAWPEYASSLICLGSVTIRSGMEKVPGVTFCRSTRRDLGEGERFLERVGGCAVDAFAHRHRLHPGCVRQEVKPGTSLPSWGRQKVKPGTFSTLAATRHAVVRVTQSRVTAAKTRSRR